MDTIINNIPVILSSLATIAIAIASIYWGKGYKVAKKAEINAIKEQILILKERISFYKEMYSETVIDYYKNNSKELELIIKHLESEIEKYKSPISIEKLKGFKQNYDYDVLSDDGILKKLFKDEIKGEIKKENKREESYNKIKKRYLN
jgi:hypothetical protein